MRIAVVGSGVSGLTAAYALHRAGHRVTIYEREATPGGHVTTIDVLTPAGSAAVDMGFIVYNEPTYPLLTRLFDELGVATQPSDMSFASACRACDVEFGTRGVGGFFAQRTLAMRPGYLRMLTDVLSFYKDARRILDAPAPSGMTLGEYLDDRRFGPGFREHFLIPITAAVWSTPPGETTEYPLDYLLRFLDNHGLIGVGRSHPWRTVTGGSQSYVDRLLANLPADTLRAGDAVVDVTRDASGVRIRTASGALEVMEAVVLATHADDALQLLADVDGAEQAALSRFGYTRNEVVLHTDARLMPRRRGAWSSWNVEQIACRAPGTPLTMTYHMDRLQRLDGSPGMFVSINPGDRVRDERVILARTFAHPRYSAATLAGQSLIAGLQGHRATWYAGAHLGWGFHEDGCRSGYEVAERIGVAVAEHAA